MNRETKIAFKRWVYIIIRICLFFSLNNKTNIYKEKDSYKIYYLFPKVNKFGMINRLLTYHKLLFTVIKVDWNKNDISLIIICNHEKISPQSFNIWQKHNFDPYILGLQSI